MINTDMNTRYERLPYCSISKVIIIEMSQLVRLLDTDSLLIDLISRSFSPPVY